ncbi:MAG: hypothetical protein R3308_03040 [Thiohalobacterales bacterium]|nr:hypothetical protein [Thiohalobacterales bacterium]
MTIGNKRILVIGYGRIGHAMESMLAPNHALMYTDIRPVSPHEPVELEQAAAAAEFVICCVHVTPLAEVAARIRPHLREDAISLTVAKGLDEEGRPASSIFADVFGDSHHYCALYGPMIAEDIIQGRMAFAQVGCSRPEVYARIEALFHDTVLRLQYSDDMPGIAWSSVLKNVYAILFGAVDELALGDNVRGYLAVETLAEMAAIVQAMGGDAATVLQVAGLGDLVTTATSESSRHHTLGRQLVRGDYPDKPAEGLHTLAMIDKFGLIDTQPYPLFRLVQQIVSDRDRIDGHIRAWLDSL